MYINDDSGGFFALLKWTCTALLFADNLGMIPFVHFGKKCKYYEEGIHYCDNPFEYYFNPASEITMEDIENGYNVVDFDKKHRNVEGVTYGGQMDTPFIDKYAAIVKSILV